MTRRSSAQDDLNQRRSMALVTHAAARHVGDRLEHALRAIVVSHTEGGGRPPAFIAARLIRNDYDHRIDVRLEFVGARERYYIVEFTRLETERAGISIDAFRDVDRFCRHCYSRLVEDGSLDRDLRSMREAVANLYRLDAAPEVILRAEGILLEREQHVRRHHRPRFIAPLGAAIDPTEFGRPDGIVEINPADLRAVYPTATEIRQQQQQASIRAERLGHFVREVTAAFIAGNLFAPYLAAGFGLEIGTPEAQAKGLDLLRANLTPAQLEEYDKHKHFHARGCDTGGRYRIHHGRQMNIDALDAKGRRTHGLCFLPEGNLVAGDCMLAQKIALETAELEALKIANRFA